MIHNDFTEKQLKNFLTLPGEKLLVARQQHWSVLIFPLLRTFLFSCFVIGSFYLVIIFAYPSILLLLSFTLLIITTMLSVMLKQIIDWYYHLYIITSRKITEVVCAPFFSDAINDVILDQVRITEIDVKITNAIGEFLDVGDIIITFDRPSHETVFTIKSIKDPTKVGAYLSDELESIMHSMAVWFQRGQMPEHVKFNEDIFPGDEI